MPQIRRQPSIFASDARSTNRSARFSGTLRRRLLLALFAGGLLFSQSVFAQHLHSDAEPGADCAVCLQLDHTALALPEPGSASFVAFAPIAVADPAAIDPVAHRPLGYSPRGPPRS